MNRFLVKTKKIFSLFAVMASLAVFVPSSGQAQGNPSALSDVLASPVCQVIGIFDSRITVALLSVAIVVMAVMALLGNINMGMIVKILVAIGLLASITVATNVFLGSDCSQNTSDLQGTVSTSSP